MSRGKVEFHAVIGSQWGSKTLKTLKSQMHAYFLGVTVGGLFTTSKHTVVLIPLLVLGTAADLSSSLLPLISSALLFSFLDWLLRDSSRT